MVALKECLKLYIKRKNMKLKILMMAVAAVCAGGAQGYIVQIGDMYFGTMSEQYLTMAVECGNTEDNGIDAPVRPQRVTSDFDPGIDPFKYWTGGTYKGDVIIPAEVENYYARYVVQEIHMGAFCYSPITSITIPETIAYVGKGAFAFCYSLRQIEIPNSVTKIGAFAFEDCRTLEQVSFSTNCDKIDSYTFYQTGQNRDELTLLGVDNVTRIGHYAFAFSSLKEYPNWYKLVQLGNNVFFESALESAHIPAGCVLGSEVFMDCAKLKTVELPADCPENIDLQFKNCPAIDLIRIESAAPPALSADWASKVASGCVLEVPAESIEMYRAAPYWKEFTTIRALTTGIDEVPAGDFTAKGLSGSISVSGSSRVSIYDMNGVCIYQGECGEVTAAPGIYVVKSPSASVKVQVM